MEENLPVSRNRYSVVVIPAYEPSPVLIPLVADLIRADYKVIVVDDGSGDGFGNIWDELDACALLMHHARNMGKGASIKTAFKYINDMMPDAGYIITMDADGQHRIDDMEHTAQCAWLHPGALVLGSRGFDGDVPLRPRLGNAITRRVFSLAAHTRVGDTQTGLRAFDRSLLGFMLETEGERYEYEMNVLLRCGRCGIHIIEVPITTVYLDKRNSSSHFNGFRDSIRIYKRIFKFASASLISFCADYLLFLLLTAMFPAGAVFVIASNVIARIGSAALNYSLNSKAVFHDDAPAVKTLPKYAALAAARPSSSSTPYLRYFLKHINAAAATSQIAPPLPSALITGIRKSKTPHRRLPCIQLSIYQSAPMLLFLSLCAARSCGTASPAQNTVQQGRANLHYIAAVSLSALFIFTVTSMRRRKILGQSGAAYIAGRTAAGRIEFVRKHVMQFELIYGVFYHAACPEAVVRPGKGIRSVVQQGAQPEIAPA